ncbi:MAG: stage II sporulation protein M [Clostridia bacterium]|nr:stage II sporulation protein M [Clostridia bacterium]
MKEESFIKNHSILWKELEQLNHIINKKGYNSLSSMEIKNYLTLYKRSSYHLSYARTHFPNTQILDYLNTLVSKCQVHVYSVRKISPRYFFNYLTTIFPTLIGKFKWYVLSAFSIFMFGFILSLIMVLVNTETARFFLPSYLVESIQSNSVGGTWDSSYFPVLSSTIMINNISVALYAFVLGITLGLGTIYVLFKNGALLGALTGLIYLFSDPYIYWSLILPHGILELFAIFVSGGAGLIIAKSLLLPKQYARKHAIIKGSKEAISLMGGVITLLIITGTIEGFFTPLNISPTIKLVFSFVTLLLLIVYLALPKLKS